MSDRSTRINLENAQEQIINPATEENQTNGNQKTRIIDSNTGNEVSVQYPFSGDGDSIYVKDIDIINSDNGDFSGAVTDYFNSLKTVNTDLTSNNPKIITIKFNRSIQTSAIGLGCDDITKNFSNLKIKLLGSADEIRQIIDNSADNTKRNSFVPAFTPDTANGIIIEFHTADSVSLSNLIIYKSENRNSRIQALSDLTGEIENVNSFRGALRITDGLVHRASVNEFFIRDVGPSTTLAVEAVSGDISITVADSTGFTTGDLIKLGITTLQEVGIITITNVVGNVITLDRPVCCDKPIGTVVKEVENDMTSLAGTLTTPQIYRLAPPVGVIWQITRILINMTDSTAMDDGQFGGIPALTNGAVGRANTGAGRLANITNWKTNGDMMLDMYDIEYNDKAPSGGYGLRGRWTFTNGKFVAELNGDNGEYIDILIQDDITALGSFRIKAQGRIFGV